MSHLSRRLGAATLAGSLLLLGACGGGGTQDAGGAASPSSPATSSSPDASGGPGASSSPTAADLPKLSADEFYQAVYDAQQKAGSYHFTLTSATPQGGLTGQGDVDSTADRPAVRTMIKNPSGTIESIVVDGLLYIKAAALHTKKPWLKIDPSDKSGFGALAGQLGASSDPAKILTALKDPKSFEVTGEQDVDGVATTHYVITVGSKKVFAALGLPKQLMAAAQLPDTFGYQMWVDADNLPRKTEQTLEISSQKVTTSITFSAYGEPVTVQAPPPGQTTTEGPKIPKG